MSDNHDTARDDTARDDTARDNTARDDTARDLDAIRRVLARLVQLYDHHRHDDWVDECLTEGMTLNAPEASLHGREEVRAMTRTIPDHGWRGVHLLGQPEITLAGTSAQARTDVVSIRATGPGTYVLTSVGSYDDDLVRADDGLWRIAARRRTFGLPAEPVGADSATRG